MLTTIAKSMGVGLVLGAAAAFAASSDHAAPDRNPAAVQAPATSGSSRVVPPGKVALPPLPFAEMPDARMPKPPQVAPLPDGTAPARPPRPI
jgi:hypothetical protein